MFVKSWKFEYMNISYVCGIELGPFQGEVNSHSLAGDVQDCPVARIKNSKYRSNTFSKANLCQIILFGEKPHLADKYTHNSTTTHSFLPFE